MSNCMINKANTYKSRAGQKQLNWPDSLLYLFIENQTQTQPKTDPNQTQTRLKRDSNQTQTRLKRDSNQN